MASTRSHSRSSYSVLLLQKLLNLRDGVSPLTLVLDSLEESGVPIVEEFMLRAKTGGTRVIYVSSSITGQRRSPHIDVLIERKNRSLEAFRDEIMLQRQAGLARPLGRGNASPQKTLIVVDSLCQISRQDPLFVAAFVSSLVSPTVSLLGLYHADEPSSLDFRAFSARSPANIGIGKPPPLKVLCHLATAIVRVQALHEEVARKRARDRSQEEPRFGLTEGEGWPFGYSNNTYSKRDLVGPLYSDAILLEMELRRRSGRSVVERYVLVLGGQKANQQQQQQQQQEQTQQLSTQPPQSSQQAQLSPTQRHHLMPWDAGATPCADITVMADHPLFATPPDPRDIGALGAGADNEGEDDGLPGSTFNLGLTDKQRRDRESVVLPYFDAQTDIGAGEGGRILYDMGREDDFDDEEDEI